MFMFAKPLSSRTHGDRQPPGTIAALDIGTTKVCCIIAAVSGRGEITILGIGNTPSAGLNRGVVVNIEKTVRSIERAVEEAQQRSGVTIGEVTVGIAGDHIQSFQCRSVVAIANPDHEIHQRDVNRLLADAKRVAIPSDRKIIHIIPQEFIVDGQDGVHDPVGMSGVRMEANVHIVTGLVTAAENIYKCVERAGLAVKDMVLEPLASSYAVLDDEEKEVGVTLIDIGGGTTDIAIFEEHTIRHTAVIGIAGRKVTDDIRKGLGLLHDQAEKLKRTYGVAWSELVINDEEIVVPGIGGRKPTAIAKSLLCRVIQPRMEEILEFALMEIRRSGYAKHLAAGAVITGGGALIRGTAELAQHVLNMPVKIGIPVGFGGGLAPEVENPMYATAVGLLIHEVRHLEQTAFHDDDPHDDRPRRNILTRMKGWFDEL
jgi:cell division protein FtsA